jgi:hypothetical protein
MRNQWKQRMLVPVACALLAVGCGQGDKATDHRAAQDADDSTERVSLSGCIGVAPGQANQFALQHVRIAPLAEQPSDAMTYRATPPINEGSWVRLAMSHDEQQLRERVGERVTIFGTVRDDGRDMVGTGGPAVGPQQPDPREKQSRAGEDEHHSDKRAQEAGPIGQQSMATGYAPLIMVQRIEGTGEKCDPELRDPQDRR